LKSSRLAARVALAALLLSGVPAAFATGYGDVVRLRPTHTQVGLAKVILRVSDLTYEEAGTLVGSYEIRIPLAPWRNDRGEVRLAVDGPLDRIMARGGTVTGSGLSHEDGRTLPIECRFLSGGKVEITVDSGERILAFRSRVESPIVR